MINVSQTIKNSCKADKNTHTEYIVINNQTIYIKGKLSATAYKDTTFFGTFNMKVLEFETENTTQFRNREFEYYKVIDGNTFKIGTFITTEVVDNDSKNTIKVTANDYALKFAVPYTTSLNYESGEVTLMDVLEECCTNAGVTLENLSIDNGNFIVDSNQFVNNELIGDVICAIAGISGNFATITSQDKLRLIFTNNTDEVLSDYTNLNDKRDTHPITSVSIGTSQVEGQEAILRDETLIEQYGEHWLTINDNPFSYTLEKRQQLVTAIFNKVKGFGYSSFKSEYTYRPYLELGDKIKFKNKAGQLIDSIILRYEMDFDDCTFEAPSITSSEVDYEKSPSAEEKAKRAEVIANQAEAQITAIASEQDNLENRVSSAEATISSQGARLDIISTNIDPTTGDVTELKRTNYEFGANGIVIESDDGFKSIKNTKGDYYYENDTMIGKYTKDGSVQKDIALFGKYYYGIDENLDVENFTKDDAMFVAQLYEDSNGETAFGHFSNQ